MKSMSSSQPLATCATRVVAGNLRNACRRCTSCSILVKPGKGDQAEPSQHVLDGFGAPFLLEKVLEHWNQAALGGISSLSLKAMLSSDSALESVLNPETDIGASEN